MDSYLIFNSLLIGQTASAQSGNGLTMKEQAVSVGKAEVPVHISPVMLLIKKEICYFAQ